MMKVKLSYKSLMFFLIGLYTVLPDYFKIIGQNSALMCAFLIIGIYFLFSIRDKLVLDKKVLCFCLIYVIFAGMMHSLHGEWTQTIRVILENSVLLLIINRMLRTKEDYQKLIKTIIGFAIFEALLGFVHFFTDFNVFSLLQSENLPPFSLDSATQYRNGMVRVEGSFGHAITYSIYISICACLCLYIYNAERRRKYLGYYFICVLSVFTSISRMPIIVFLASQMIYLIALDYKKALRVVKKVLLVAVPVTFLVAILMPEVFKIVLRIVFLVADVFSSTGLSGLTTYEVNSAFSYRIELLRVLPDLIKEKPIFGIGGANYRSSTFYFLINGSRQTSIDNEYLHHLLLYGIWGLMGLIWWVFGSMIFDKSPSKKEVKETTLKFYKGLIIFIYSINLLSVAMMFEYKLIIVLIAIFFADIRIRKQEVNS